MKKSGLADSPFFSTPQKKIGITTPHLNEHPSGKKKLKTDKHSKRTQSTKKPRHRDTMTPRSHAIITSRMTSRHHDAIIEFIRKSVKVVGKEPSTHRLTPEEKKAITDIIYAYKGNGIKTSENEIARIAINFVVNDYRANGENSILHKVLRALNE